MLMKKIITLLFTSMFLFGMIQQLNAQSAIQDMQNEMSSSVSAKTVIIKPPVTWTYFSSSKSGMLYDNGPLVNIPGAAGNPDTSRLQSVTLTMNTLGFGIQFTSTINNRIADDFTIADSAWVIDSIVFFTYQTGSTTSSTTTASNLRIWDGSPELLTSNIVLGDDVTNIMVDSYWDNMYRDSESATGIGLTNRPIMRNILGTNGWILSPGTYWVDYQAEGSLTSGPWAPPITINGLNVTGNALQMTSTGWAPANDSGTLTQQGLPFIIYGYKTEASSTGDLLATLPVRMFPNPASDQVTIQSPSAVSRVQITNQLGQAVHDSNPGTGNFSIDLSQLTPGMYVITTWTNNSASSAKLIVR